MDLLLTCSDNWLPFLNFIAMFVLQELKNQLGFILGLFFRVSSAKKKQQNKTQKSAELLDLALCIICGSQSSSF